MYSNRRKKMNTHLTTEKKKTLEGKFDKFFDNATHYFEKVTDKQLYTYRNILEYVDGEYLITNPITEENLRGMRENMDDSDLEQFDAFVEKHWKKSSRVAVTVNNTEDITEVKPKKKRQKTKDRAIIIRR